MSHHRTSGDTCGVTSSPESAAGISPSSSRAGRRNGKSGLDHVPARRSASRAEKNAALVAKARTLCRILSERGISCAVHVDTTGSPTIATSGRSSVASSASAALNALLESRLTARMDLSGSPECRLVWKRSAMLWGGPIFRLRASPRPRDDSAYGGWPTPNCCDATRRSPETDQQKNARGAHPGLAMLDVAATVSPWATPNTNRSGPEAQLSKKSRGSGGIDLQSQVRFCPWATPEAVDGRSDRCSIGRGALRGSKGHPLRGQVLEAWSTPRAQERQQQNSRDAGQALSKQVSGASSTSSGATSGLAAGAGSRGALNPDHSRWLMGFPKAWADCAPKTLTKSRRR